MKNIKQTILITVLLILLPVINSCESLTSSSSESSSSSKICYHNDKQLYTGPQGGCYYINSNGNKTYVDRSECDC